MYGAGLIEEVAESEQDGASQLYYVLRISVGDLRIMIPTSKAECLGIRPIQSREQMLGVFAAAGSRVCPMPDNWNQRYKENLERIKTGHLDEVVTVFRSLLSRERGKVLSSAEKKMLSAVKQILLSELILSLGVDKDQAEEVLFAAAADPGYAEARIGCALLN